MNKAKINSLYEQAHVIYETPYESSVVDPTIRSIHKHIVWDRYLFAELIVKECADFLKDKMDDHFAAEQLEEHFGVEE